MPHSALSTFHLSAGTSIARAQPPQQERVTLESPGMAVMTDLTQVRAATVQPSAALAQAELMMIHQGVRLLFVVTQMPGVDVSASAPMRIWGVISKTQIERQTGALLPVTGMATRLAEMSATLA